MKKLLVLMIVVTTMFVISCSEGNVEKTIQSPLVEKTKTRGNQRLDTLNYTVASCEDGIVNKGYKSGIIYYPKECKSNNMPIVVVMHGFFSKKERMAWLGKELAKRGFVVMLTTGINNRRVLTRPSDWVYNYEVAVQSIKAENLRKDSPLYRRMDTQEINLVGHSMGGGGVLYFADKTEHQIRSIVAMAPYSLQKVKPGGNTKAPTLVLAGSLDILALPSMTRKIYKTIASKKKNYVYFRGIGHLDFENHISKHPDIAESVFNWLDKYGR